MSISPLNPTVQFGGTQQFTTTAFDAGSHNVTSVFPRTFSSSNSSVGTISSTGLFTAHGCGTTNVRVDYTVLPPDVHSVRAGPRSHSASPTAS
ncbi:MAG: Ig-like domain-containing protein [Phycisphaerae bacterium]|nr:Ig-like domain-containing protein [Gemmatimonadaceae bacterium]